MKIINKTLDTLIPQRHDVAKKLKEKVRESVSSVLPITLLVMLLSVRLLPVDLSTMGMFVTGAVAMVFGMGLFTLGAESAMLPMGSHMGAQMTKSKNIWFMVISAFLMGVLITVAEPDLTVLAQQIQGVPKMAIIITVGVGVGMFLVFALLRILFRIRLSYILMGLYALVFLLGAFVPAEKIALCFDSGGVTTGPMTVPFILALGVGVANVRAGKGSNDDSFGLISLCSVGPILSVMILCLVCPNLTATPDSQAVAVITDTRDLLDNYLNLLPHYMLDVVTALLPIVVMFIVFQIFFLHISATALKRILVGVLYTYVGLVIFLLGVNAGFLPMGSFLGKAIGSGNASWTLVPLGMLMGYLVVMAEPAVHVLNEQVEQLTAGAINRQTMMRTLCIGVSISVGVAMLRVVTGVSLWWFILPGYVISLALSFAVDPVFTAIAFDSGGVASGPMTAAFMLPMAMGACSAMGQDVLSCAFGLVAMVALAPLLAIQLLGFVYKQKIKKMHKATEKAVDDEIIDL